MNDNEDHHQVSVDKDSSQENMVDSISPFVASVNDEDGSNEVGQVYCVFLKIAFFKCSFPIYSFPRLLLSGCV